MTVSTPASPFTAHLGSYAPAVQAALDELEQLNVAERLWALDHTIWRQDPAEISNRLGWLRLGEAMQSELPSLQALAREVQQEGYRDVLLLGMGGSSLAPDVFSHVFGGEGRGLHLAVLDSTDPEAVLAQAARLEPAKTLFIVSTKSGGTVETLSFFKFFYNWTLEALGKEAAGTHFVAITDPGSKLQALAERYAFRLLFLNDPNIGGRYSALSHFGLVPASLLGVDVAGLLARAREMMAACQLPARENPGLRLGAILGELARQRRDKVSLVTSPRLANFGDWVEQLIAESSGKEGTGILPVVGESLGPPGVYGSDRLFVHLSLAGEAVDDPALAALEAAGHPLVRLVLNDLLDLGGQFLLWEVATAVAGQRLGIQPFDQPNVEAAKVLARNMVAAYQKTGALPAAETAPATAEALHRFLAQAEPGDYIALQAYLAPGLAVDQALNALRLSLRQKTRLATTVGYGPRFLHSTGQLHKGDAGNGLFIQFTSTPATDAPIPDDAGSPASTMTFGVLKQAQAQGDYEALRAALPPRRVIHFHLGSDPAAAIRALAG